MSETNEIQVKGITTGNFAFDLAVSPSERVKEILLQMGIKTAIQTRLMAWEKAMAYPDVIEEKDGKKVLTKVKRPAKFTRKQIGFTQQAAEELAKFVADATLDVADYDSDPKAEAKPESLGIMDVANVVEYLGVTYSPVFRDQKELVTAYLFEPDGKTARKLKSGEDRSIESFCSSRGLEAPTDPWEEDKAWLSEVKAWQKEQASVD